MNPITLGHVEAHEKLTARVFFIPDGSEGYYDLGNIKEYNEAHEYAAVTRVVAEKGYRRTNDEQIDVITAAWEFTLDEVDKDTLAFLNQGTTAAESQAAVTAPAGTGGVTLTAGNLGTWMPLGKVGLNTLVVKDDATPTPNTLSLGSDYEVDLGSGMIRFLTGVGELRTWTFGAAAVDFEVITGLNRPTLRGLFEIHEYNQHATIPLKTTNLEGVLRATEFPSQSGEIGTWKVRVTATSKPVVKRRSVVL